MPLLLMLMNKNHSEISAKHLHCLVSTYMKSQTPCDTLEIDCQLFLLAIGLYCMSGQKTNIFWFATILGRVLPKSACQCPLQVATHFMCAIIGSSYGMGMCCEKKTKIE